MSERTKKPNSFIKGMQSDIDPNLIPEGSYLSAFNGRLTTKGDNLYTLSAAESNTVFASTSDSKKSFSNFNVVLGSDERTIGSNTYNVSRYIKTVTVTFSYNSTTYTYSEDVLNHANSTQGKIISAIRNFLFPVTATSASEDIKSKFDIYINNSQGSVLVEPLSPGTISSYTLSVSTTVKSTTFAVFSGLAIPSRGTSSDSEIAANFIYGDANKTYSYQSPAVDYTDTEAVIDVVRPIVENIDSDASVTNVGTGVNSKIDFCLIDEDSDAVYIKTFDDTAIDFVPYIIRESSEGLISHVDFSAITSQTNNGNGYSESIVNASMTTYTVEDSEKIVGVASFSEYLVVLTHNSQNTTDNVYQYFTNDNGELLKKHTVFSGINLGFTDDTILRIETSEENELYHRLYWTDGKNPLRTINLKESEEYYQNLESADDLNIFNSRFQSPPDIVSLIDGGSVKCGAHSYCYRLKSADGKQSKVSNISEPLHVFQSSRDTSFHQIKGGSIEATSNSSVEINVSGISSAFTNIEIINIFYTNEIGSIETNIISSGALVNGEYTYKHVGTETADPLDLNEIFQIDNPWDTCQSIAIKDNRLFAANLSRAITDIDTEFRVKSYKKDVSANTWSKQPDVINPDLHTDIFYDDGVQPHYGGTREKYAYLNGANFNGKYIPGAESDGYSNGNGVRVTFGVKEIDLGQQIYFQKDIGGIYDNDAGDDEARAFTAYNRVPLYSQNLDTDGPDGMFNNYKNPFIAKDFKGYQRGEIYRFGILFYDKALNPGFVSPIGDIRMPDNATKYAEISSGGQVIETSPGGSKYFKHCGSSSFFVEGNTNGNHIINHTADSRIVVGMHVFGPDIPAGSRVVSITSSTQFTMSKSTSVTTTTGIQIGFVDPLDNNMKGYILRPVFDVKLNDDIRSKIGGYSIVRVDRREQDKRVLFNGIHTPIVSLENTNGTILKNQTALFAAAHGSPDYRHKNSRIGFSSFTFDCPEINLAGKTYTSRGGDSVYVNCRLDAIQNPFNSDFLVDGQPTTSNHRHVSGFRAKESGNISAGRLYFGGTDATNNTAGNSMYTVFTVNDDSLYYNSVNFGDNKIVGIRARNENTPYRPLLNAISIAAGADGFVTSVNHSHDGGYIGATGQNFTNRALCITRQKESGGGSGLNIYPSPKTFDSKYNGASTNDDGVSGYDDNLKDGRAVLSGCPSTFLVLDNTELQLNLLGLGVSTETSANNNVSYGSANYEPGGNELQRINYYAEMDSPNGAILYASKAYLSIIRNVGTAAYGGDSLSSFANNNYILTGHTNFAPVSGIMRDEVYGGDTYINMYSLRKLVYSSHTENGLKNNIGFVFPVESTINVDMRGGDYFGSTDELAHNIHDANLYGNSYSARNTSKVFIEKPADFSEISTMSNVVAASDLKLAGDTVDAFTNFSPAEQHELNTKYGPIHNIFNLRGDLFTLQNDAVSKLSINPRVVVDNADAAAVTIATGTGAVIERSDYVDTQYGSQHFNNVITTGLAAYWYDSYRSSFCKLNYGQAIAVEDLGITTQNSNILDSLKDYSLNDTPTSISKGGICLSHDYRHSEITLSVTFPDYTKNLSITYSEILNTLVSKKYQSVVLSAAHKGETYTVGYTKLDGTENYDNSTLWLENSSSNCNSYYNVNIPKALDVTFVCNESVYSTKKFDKLVVYCSGNNNSKKFTTFTFTDSVSNSSVVNNEFADKVSNGKHIVPITDGTNKTQGQYLIINATAPTSNYPVDLFGALVHNRIVK